MVFFKKSPPEDDAGTDKWKTKYLSLLDEYDALKAAQFEEQNLLKKKPSCD